MADGMAMRFSRNGKAGGEPTPLLSFLAGPHASAVAACWPAPHERFFALPAARRHAAVILLARGERDPDALVRMVERYKDSDIARRLVPQGDVPAGLMKAMARMGETQWRMEDYELFLTLFRDAQAAPVLRHMAGIRPGQLALIGALPAGLREAPIVALVPHVGAARDLGHAFELALKIQGEDKPARLAARWSRAKDAHKLFAMAAGGLEPQRFGPPPAVPVLPAVFEPVTTRKHLAAIALEFQNCLRDFAFDLAMGRMAVFAWRTDPPVVLALRWDAAGWRLAEAELRANDEVGEPQLRALVALLADAGVRTGPPLGLLSRRLVNHANGYADPVGESFRDRLELGEFWD